MGDEMKKIARADFYDRLSVCGREFVLPDQGETDAARFWKRVLDEHRKNVKEAEHGQR